MGLLTQITAADRVSKFESNEPQPSLSQTAGPATITALAEPRSLPAARVADQPETSTLPPPIPCLICECPAIWISIYDRDSDDHAERSNWRCCECDPPPGGWGGPGRINRDGSVTLPRGGWPMVGRRLLLVFWKGVWEWEDFPRDDYSDFEIECVTLKN